MTDSKHPIETRQELGILPVRNTVLFPEVTVPILVGREKSKQLVKALSGETSPLLGVIAQRTPEPCQMRRSLEFSGLGAHLYRKFDLNS